MKRFSKILYLNAVGHELTTGFTKILSLPFFDGFGSFYTKTIMNKLLFMKHTLFTCLLVMVLSVSSYGQVQADPGVSGFEITDNLGVPQNANMLFQNANYHLKLSIFNSNQAFALPAGSSKVSIGMGSKSVPLNTAVPTTSYSQYFTWTAALVSGQWQVTGDLTSPLPADFNGVIDIPFTPHTLGNSTFTANFLITNHANVPPNILSDEDPTNNSTSTSYTVVPNAPVKFTSLDLLKSGCNIKVSFNTEEELNVDHYEIEASKDGTNFIKVAQLTAKNQHLYKADFALTSQLNGANVFVRVKSVDKDGRFQYSDIKTISGTCAKKLEMNLYPNPVTDKKSVVINATEGLFNGRYKVSIRDFAGKLVRVKEIDLDNVAHFDCELGNLAAGKYIVQVMNNDGSESAVLQLQKL
jgi:hypothetical protein